MAVTGRIVLVILVALFGASCSNGDGAGGGNTLLEGGRVATTGPLTTTTTAAPQPATTTTVAASPTTSVATVVSNETTTTTTSEVEVAAGGTDSDGTPVQLPLTGPEPGVAAAALIALLVGVWLLRWSWRERALQVYAVLWRRAPEGDWPPDAVAPRTRADRRFRRAARREARRRGLEFVEGVDVHATAWAAAHTSADELSPEGLGLLAEWRSAVARQARRIYR